MQAHLAGETRTPVVLWAKDETLRANLAKGTLCAETMYHLITTGLFGKVVPDEQNKASAKALLL